MRAFQKYLDEVIEELEKIKFPDIINPIIGEGKLTTEASAGVLARVAVGAFKTGLPAEMCARAIYDGLMLVIIEKAAEEQKH